MKADTIKVFGTIKGVEITDGVGPKGKWQRAGIKILDMETGKEITVATFNEEDINFANMHNGKDVQIAYTLNGTYKNLCKGGIEDYSGEPEDPNVEEVDMTEQPKPVKSVVKAAEPKEQISKGPGQESYVPEKVKQTWIVRQNSLTQAQNYIANLLKAVELGLIDKKDFPASEISTENVFKLAGKFASEVMKD